MKEDLNLLPWEGVSLEEVLSLFTEDFPPIDIADGAPTATEQLPHAPVLVSAPASTLPSADPNSEPPVSGKVYVMPDDGNQASLQDVIMAQQTNKPAHLDDHEAPEGNLAFFYTCMLQYI
jgi:hypothetical protein